MVLNYHQAIFNLIGVEPEMDTTRLVQLEAIEHEYDIELPASIKEWFSIVNLSNFLKNYSSFTWQATLGTFCVEEQVEGLLARNNQHVAQRKVIPILKERNGDWLWLINLQEENMDPKIVLQAKDFPDMLMSHPHRFAKQAFLNIWDFLVTSLQFEGFYLKASCPPMKRDTPNFLRSHFNEISTTFMLVINETTYRFQKKDHFIMAIEDGLSTNWYFYAKNKAALERMLQIVLKLKPVKENIITIPSGKSDLEKSLNVQTMTQILNRFS